MSTATASATHALTRSGVGSRRRVARPPAPEPPTIVSVFFHSDGTICHAWCGRPLEFHGSRGGVELDFFCTRCMEHVTLPHSVLSRVPVVAAR